MIYYTLYKSSCYQAAQKIFSSASFSKSLCQSVENQLIKLFSTYTSQSSTSLDVYRSSLQGNQKYLENIKSNRTCLLCLHRKPEHALPCGHAFCDNCVLRFGEGMVGFEHRYILKFCSICSSQNGLVVELKGPTAGINILCVDGGGSRGIIPLEVLSSLQAMIGPDLPIQDFFDLKFGTSAGKLSH
jgi:hypothetical protein